MSCQYCHKLYDLYTSLEITENCCDECWYQLVDTHKICLVCGTFYNKCQSCGYSSVIECRKCTQSVADYSIRYCEDCI